MFGLTSVGLTSVGPTSVSLTSVGPTSVSLTSVGPTSVGLTSIDLTSVGLTVQHTCTHTNRLPNISHSGAGGRGVDLTRA